MQSLLRGLRLGLVLRNVRCGGYASVVDQLRDMGIVVDNVITCPDFNRNFAALKVFKQLYGHVKVPFDYKIPNLDPNYDLDAWGLKLRSWLSCVRAGAVTKNIKMN